MRKRYYIMLVMRDVEGQLRKINIPLHYVYVFLAGAVLGMFTITGIAGSYTRMLMKVARFDELRTEKEAITRQYSRLERVAKEKDIQVASLGSLASEVSALYGLKSESILEDVSRQQFTQEQVQSSLSQLSALRTTALTGAAAIAMSFGPGRNLTTADWLRLAAAPNLWPVEGHITSSFGERIDPFNGEGAFHTGVDISTSFGRSVIAPADGVVVFAGSRGGYGRVVEIDHGHGIMTRFGHLSSYVVAEGQRLQRGDKVGFVGLSGRTTAPHVHYEVRIHGAPVNPYKYLRTTIAHSGLPNSEG